MNLLLGLEEAAFLLLGVVLLGWTRSLAGPTVRSCLLSGAALLGLGGAVLIALPVHPAGLLFLGLAVAALSMEVLAYPGMGLHAIGGGLSLLLAGLFLIGPWSGAHPLLAAPVAVAVGAATYLTGRRSWRYVRNRPMLPSPRIEGRRTVMLDSDGRSGHGVVGGEVWVLRTRSGELRQGQAVEVVQACERHLDVVASRHHYFS